MNKWKTLLAMFILAPATHYCKAQSTRDHLGVPGPIEFNGTTYQLCSSTTTKEHYILQEYIPEGDSIAHFKQLFSIQFIADTNAMSRVIANEEALLKKRSHSDPVLNYKLLKNKAGDENMLDFVLGDGKEYLNFVEWDAHRYLYIKDSAGRRKGLILIGISIREYDDIREFLGSLRTLRSTMIPILGKFSAPDISVD